MTDTQKRIKSILRDVTLDRVDIRASIHGVTAEAVPNSFHKMVTTRREEAVAARSGSISMAEAEQIATDSRKPVARGQGATIDEALAVLVAELKAVES